MYVFNFILIRNIEEVVFERFLEIVIFFYINEIEGVNKIKKLYK